MNTTTSSYYSTTTIGSYDVLLGRGGKTNGSEGNINFREIVATRSQDYLHAKKPDKIHIAKSVVVAVHNQGGRFLEKKQCEMGEDIWVEVPEERALKKASQALREKLDVRNGGYRLKLKAPKAIPKVRQVQGPVFKKSKTTTSEMSESLRSLLSCMMSAATPEDPEGEGQKVSPVEPEPTPSLFFEETEAIEEELVLSEVSDEFEELFEFRYPMLAEPIASFDAHDLDHDETD